MTRGIMGTVLFCLVARRLLIFVAPLCKDQQFLWFKFIFIMIMSWVKKIQINFSSIFKQQFFSTNSFVINTQMFTRVNIFSSTIGYQFFLLIFFQWYFPDDWKATRVQTITKNNSRSSSNKYLSMSMSSFLSKVVEIFDPFKTPYKGSNHWWSHFFCP